MWVVYCILRLFIYVVVFYVFFFFKQKTAYEMRISDWSSDVCSSDLVYVDYAHTPDALETVLKALRPHTQNQLFVIIGCGGDRDRGKRPIMGRIAATLADRAIITDDNPRSEDPAATRQEIRSEEHTSELQSITRSSYAVLGW